MDLSDVASFVRVVEYRGFTPAARALGIPKSTLSRRMVRLEQSLGVRLLQRTSRRQSLTDAGSAFYERVKSSVETIEAASAAAAELSDEPRGHLRIASLPEVGGEAVAAIMTEFLRRHPKITVELHVSPNRVDLIAERYDAAIRAGKLDDSSLVARKLVDSDLRLYASPAYLEEHGRPRRFRDLEQHEHVSLVQMPAVTLSSARGKVRYRPRSRLRANDMQPLYDAVRAGLGIGLLPTMLCEEDVRQGRLDNVLPQYSLAGSPVSFVYPSGRHLDAKLRAVRDFLLERTAGHRS